MEYRDLTAKLPNGKMPKEPLTDPEAGDTLIAYATYLAGIINKQLKAFANDSAEHWHLSVLRRQLLSFRWSFPLEVRQVAADSFDRTRPMLSGPLFTSAEHPWPSQKGRFREPVAQFDLGSVGNLGGINLGEGMLQLWVGPEWDDHLIRLIPIDGLASAPIAPIPDCITDEYFGGSPENPSYTARTHGSWPSVNSHGVKQIWEIVGTKPKVLSWPAHIKNESDDPEVERYCRSSGFFIIAQFLGLLPDEPPRPSNHFFGNFYPIQYAVEDSSPTLLGLESGGQFLWGDHGNAQIWYKIARSGKVGFGFNWSCY